jgi:hypothetical protein
MGGVQGKGRKQEGAAKQRVGAGQNMGDTVEK